MKIPIYPDDRNIIWPEGFGSFGFIEIQVEYSKERKSVPGRELLIGKTVFIKEFFKCSNQLSSRFRE